MPPGPHLMARVGFGRGFSYLNVNRDVVDPDTRLWLSSRLKPGCAEAAIDGGLMSPLVANDK
jgi:hypothetical protein